MQTGKTAAIRRRAVRENGVSRHHGMSKIEGPPQTLFYFFLLLTDLNCQAII